MNGSARRILNAIAKSGEMPLSEALQLAKARHGNHIDQYPLALLIEEGYVGISINSSPPENTENMHEMLTAINLYVWSLPEIKLHEVEYFGINFSPVDWSNERIFIKAKGALYADEANQKRRDRFYSFAIGLITGILATSISAWVRSLLHLQ